MIIINNHGRWIVSDTWPCGMSLVTVEFMTCMISMDRACKSKLNISDTSLILLSKLITKKPAVIYITWVLRCSNSWFLGNLEVCKTMVYSQPKCTVCWRWLMKRSYSECKWTTINFLKRKCVSLNLHLSMHHDWTSNKLPAHRHTGSLVIIGWTIKVRTAKLIMTSLAQYMLYIGDTQDNCQRK